MKTKKRHYLNFDIAGFSYWEGCLVFNELKIGTELTLMREEDNKFDPYAVAIYYGESKIGFIPRNANHEISKFLELGHTDLFEARINRITPDAHTESQVGVIVYIKPVKVEV
ncbi:MAG: HIRAN domain-containing protein [Paludibacteraceae bacterium]|nr:HIRAN domain-containing protein [Paludibacteraceae bacterium]MBP9017990.1 HIRAN domain-containing protein [Paludibacteraceae bacterium]